MNTSDLYSRLRHFISKENYISKQNVFKKEENEQFDSEQESSLYRLWKKIDAKADESTYSSLEKILSEIERIRPTRRFYLSSRVAALLLLPLMVSVFAYFYMYKRENSPVMVEHITPLGETQEMVLPDGTKVFLNSESSLLYPSEFNGETRTVYLVGEANFDVFKDPEHPFIVKTVRVAIQAVGTKFNVRAYPESPLQTTLESGIVRATDNYHQANNVLLYPNEQLEYDLISKTFNKITIDAQAVAGWTKDELSFIRQTLPEITKALERRYNIKIELRDDADRSNLYTVKLRKKETIENIIRIVSMTCGKDQIKYYTPNPSTLNLRSIKD